MKQILSAIKVHVKTKRLYFYHTNMGVVPAGSKKKYIRIEEEEGRRNKAIRLAKWDSEPFRERESTFSRKRTPPVAAAPP
jgi:hypothetical protein